MTSIEVADDTATLLRSQAAEAGETVDVYLRRLALIDSLRRHGQNLGERYFVDAEEERLAG